MQIRFFYEIDSYCKITCFFLQTNSRGYTNDINAVSKVALMERLEKNKVKFLVESKILQFYTDGVQYEKAGVIQELHGYDTVVLALGSKSYNPFEAELSGHISEVYTIGDARKVGQALDAIREATELALQI